MASGNTQDHRALNKAVSTSIRRDIRKFNTEQVTKVIEENKSLKVLRSKLSTGTKIIQKLKNEDGRVITDREEIMNIVEGFYKQLYKNTNNDTPYEIPHIQNQGSEDIPEITEDEIIQVLSEMKNNKSPGEDGVVVEAIKLAGPTVIRVLTILFNLCLTKSITPTQWNNAIIILLYKKGDSTDLSNYRPISILSHVYKMFTKILTKRLTSKLDFYQTPDQAGFRAGYGVNDHLLTVKLIVEKCVEYNRPLILIFVDYEKAFDSVNQDMLFKALAECRIDSRYIEIRRHIYCQATST